MPLLTMPSEYCDDDSAEGEGDDDARGRNLPLTDRESIAVGVGAPPVL